MLKVDRIINKSYVQGGETCNNKQKMQA